MIRELRGRRVKTLLQFGYELILGGAAIAAAFAIMLRFGTSPSRAFAFFLFFLVFQWILTSSLRREMVPRFVASIVLCMVSAFWLLQSTSPAFRGDGEQVDAWAIAWRSGIVLTVLLAVPRCAKRLALRSVRSFERAAG